MAGVAGVSVGVGTLADVRVEVMIVEVVPVRRLLSLVLLVEVHLLLPGLDVRLLFDVPEHVADEDRPPQVGVGPLPGHVEFVKRDVEHPGPLLPVAGGASPGEAGRVITGRGGVGRPGRRRGQSSEGLDWPPGGESGRLGLDNWSDWQVVVECAELEV